jgi:hypothetical protein
MQISGIQLIRRKSQTLSESIPTAIDPAYRSMRRGRGASIAAVWLARRGSGVVIGGGVIHSNRRSVILGVVVIGPSGRPLSLPGAAVGLRLAAMKRLSAVIGSWLRQAAPPLVFVRHQARPAE